MRTRSEVSQSKRNSGLKLISGSIGASATDLVLVEIS